MATVGAATTRQPPRCSTLRHCSRLKVCCIRRSSYAEQDIAGAQCTVLGTAVPSVKAAVLLALDRGASNILVEDAALCSDEDVQLVASSCQARLQAAAEPLQAEQLLEADQLVLPDQSSWTLAAVNAIRKGAPAISGLGFAAQALPHDFPVTAVAGSQGKASVASFCAQLLSMSGLDCWDGGADGAALAELALALRRGVHYDVATLAASSHQLALAPGFRPRAAAVLSCTPDLLDLHGSLDRQGAAMCRAFAAMTPQDFSVLPAGDDRLAELAAACGGRGRRAWLGRLPGAKVVGDEAQVMLPGAASIFSLDFSMLAVPGRHNVSNAAAAALLASLLPDLGVTRAGLQRAVPLLKLPPHRWRPACWQLHLANLQSRRAVVWPLSSVLSSHRGAAVMRSPVGTTLASHTGQGLQAACSRLQNLGERASITWIDDAASSTVDAAIAGIQCVRQPTVLVLGGCSTAEREEQLGFKELGPFVEGHRTDSWCAGVVAYGAHAERIADELRAFDCTCMTASTLAEAVQAAQELTQPGDALLFSPACSHSSEFAQRHQRGEAFQALMPAAGPPDATIQLPA